MDNNNGVDAPQRRAEFPGPTETATPQGRMELTTEERQRALSIKEAIESDPEFNNLSDFWYAQLAIIEHGNTEAAVARVRGLQHFKEEYGCMDDLTEGQGMLQKAVKLFPRHILAYMYNERDDINTLIVDDVGLDLEVLSNHEKFRVWIVSAYYLNNAMCEDMKSIRKGVNVFCECEGYRWSLGMRVSVFQKVYRELINHYPYKMNMVKLFHSGVIFNTVVSMLKKVMSEASRKALQLGCDFDGRLDQIYLSPTVEASNKRIVDRMGECLQQRYINERSFRL